MESVTFSYVDDDLTSQQARASIVCYWDGFTCLYVDDVRTSQETRLWASTARYVEALHFYMYTMFLPHRKHSYGSPLPVAGIALFYVDYVRTSQKKHLWASTVCYGDTLTFICR
jgi:hypothetical protein